MAKLTEGMVIARTRATDLENVKKLNCWGSELADVSLLRKMANVEVLSLSVNNISSLADFQHCQNLQELFIRKNKIKNIAEICYLKDLPKLRTLWLEDNPCAVGDNYRLTVLKLLPRLQKLDNIAVVPEELRNASLYGLDLLHPEDKNKNESSLTSTSSSSSFSPPFRSENNLRCITEEYDMYNSNPTPTQQQINRRDEQFRQEVIQREIAQQKKDDDFRRRLQAQKEEEHRREVESHFSQTGTQYEADTPSSSSSGSNESEGHVILPESQTPERGRATSMFGTNYIGEPQNHIHGLAARPASNPLPVSNAIYQSRPYPVGNFTETNEENANTRVSISQESDHVTHQTNFNSSHERPSPTRPYPVRPKTRNSNILSAVLCLIKELDYASLEVVEMAVRCRMDELDD